MVTSILVLFVVYFCSNVCNYGVVNRNDDYVVTTYNRNVVVWNCLFVLIAIFGGFWLNGIIGPTIPH